MSTHGRDALGPRFPAGIAAFGGNSGDAAPPKTPEIGGSGDDAELLGGPLDGLRVPRLTRDGCLWCRESITDVRGAVGHGSVEHGPIGLTHGGICTQNYWAGQGYGPRKWGHA